MADADVRWVATLSDGSTAVEHTGEYKIIPGERKPWVRLVQYAAKNDLHLTSLRLNFRGRTIHMPRPNFDRFNDVGYKSVAPIFYSINYIIEGTMEATGGDIQQDNYIDLVTHFPTYDVHYIQDVDTGSNSWVAVTEGYKPHAASPPRKE